MKYVRSAFHSRNPPCERVKGWSSYGSDSSIGRYGLAEALRLAHLSIPDPQGFGFGVK